MLENLRKKLRFKKPGEAIGRALKIADALQSQADQGFIEIAVRDPKTGRERVLVYPE
jgi:hypothetical protein